MKKLLALIMSIMLVAAFTGCAGKADNSSDYDYIKEKGTLVVGITDFAPMDYKDDDENWIGFDADMATAFANELGLKVSFVAVSYTHLTLPTKA